MWSWCHDICLRQYHLHCRVFVLLSFIFTSSLQMSLLTEHKRHHGNTVMYPDEFLNHLGYLNNSHGYWLHTRAERKNAIRLYQKLNDLQVTGKIDKSTWKLMTQPRCGVPDLRDMSPPSKLKMPRVKRQAHIITTRKKSIVLKDNRSHSKWIVDNLTWRPRRYTPDISYRDQLAVFEKAFEKWSAPSLLKVQYTTYEPDIELTFGRRDHGDGPRNAFDGRGMLLAHAYGPGDVDISGDVHFDLDEKWTVGADFEDKQSRNLATISLHEIGHSLGLPHSKNKNDIMYPVYLKDPDPNLSRNDIKQLQGLYGADPRFKRSPYRRRFKPIHRKRWKFRVDRNLPKWCLKPFNDVMRGQRGTGYILNGEYIYKIDNKGMLPGYPVHIGLEFPGAPINAMSSFYVREYSRTYFLKGTRIWRFTNQTLDPGFPMESKSRFPEKPRAALSITDKKGWTTVLLFGERLTWRWNPHTEKSNGRYHLISTYWRKLPKRLDAAVEWFDGYIYFFTRNKYFKVSKRNKVVLEGYPKFKAPSWLGGDCGNAPK